MERVIKFRVRDAETKEIIGYERINENGHWEQTRIGRKDIWLLGCITSESNLLREQFTGLTDKAGREIFEGDVVNYPFKNFNGKIEFNDGGFCIVHNAVCKCELNTAASLSIEIIGNSFTPITKK